MSPRTQKFTLRVLIHGSTPRCSHRASTRRDVTPSMAAACSVVTRLSGVCARLLFNGAPAYEEPARPGLERVEPTGAGGQLISVPGSARYEKPRPAFPLLGAACGLSPRQDGRQDQSGEDKGLGGPPFAVAFVGHRAAFRWPCTASRIATSPVSGWWSSTSGHSADSVDPSV